MREIEDGGPGQKVGVCAQAPPTRPRACPSGRRGAGDRSIDLIPFLPAPSPSPRCPFPAHASFTAGAPSTTGGKRSRCSTCCSLARAKFSAGGRGVRAGPGAPASRPRPFGPPLRGSHTFSEQLLLASLQGTDLPGQSLLQHLRGERRGLSLRLSDLLTSPPSASEILPHQ